jgi:hypothetical protein
MIAADSAQSKMMGDIKDGKLVKGTVSRACIIEEVELVSRND